MALIDNIYIHVVSEEVSRDLESSSHSVESGYDITDSVKIKPRTISLSGLIVDYPNGDSASETLRKLEALQQKGALVKYVGRNVYTNMQIQPFQTGHPNTVKGGMEFTMELKQVRIAKNAYKAPTKTNTNNAGTQQIEKGNNTAVHHTVKKGDTVWALVAASKAPYKSLSRPAINGKTYSACDWVMEQNLSAFSRKRDFRTLQIGKKLLMGYRK